MISPYLLSVLTIPAVVALLGYVLWRHPPRFSHLFGYRTRMSMSSAAMWREAQPFAGRSLVIAAGSGLAISALIYGLMGSGSGSILTSVSIQTLLVLSVIPLTERHLHRVRETDHLDDGEGERLKSRRG